MFWGGIRKKVPKAITSVVTYIVLRCDFTETESAVCSGIAKVLYHYDNGCTMMLGGGSNSSIGVYKYDIYVQAVGGASRT